MKKTIINGLVVLVVGVFVQQATQAQGTTYLSNLGQPSTGSEDVGSDSWLAADFITGNNIGGYLLNSVQLGMTDASGHPGGFTAMICVKGGAPIGAYPGSSLGILVGSADPATAGTYTYTAPSNLTLSPNADYFIALTAGTAVANGAYDWSVAGTYAYNPGGGWGVASDEGSVGIFLSSQNGSSWIPNHGNLQFALNATPIPEPSSSWLILLGSGVFIYARRTFHR
jgi:hypothetical protein